MPLPWWKIYSKFCHVTYKLVKILETKFLVWSTFPKYLLNEILTFYLFQYIFLYFIAVIPTLHTIITIT